MYFCKLQVVPHITDAIQEWIERVALIPVDGLPGPADVCVIELGGTIGKLTISFLMNGS
jgi:CTP synthase